MSNIKRLSIVLWPILYALMLWFDLAPDGFWLPMLMIWLVILYSHGQDVAKERDENFRAMAEKRKDALTKIEANNGQ